MELAPTKLAKFESEWYSKPGLIYFVAAGRPPIAIKIGVTQQTTMHRRLKAIQSANHEPVELLGVIRFSSGKKPLKDAECAEHELHQRFATTQRRINGSVGHEWFTTSQELLDYIAANATSPEEIGLERTFAQSLELSAHTIKTATYLKQIPDKGIL